MEPQLPTAPEPDEVDPPDPAELQSYLEQVADDAGLVPAEEEQG